MGKKAKKKGKRTEAVDPERVDDLMEALDEGELDDEVELEDREVEALCNRLLDDTEGGGERMAELYEAVTTKAQQKIIKRAAFRLKQRGGDVPELGDRPKGIRIAAGPLRTDDLPIVMDQPDLEGRREIYFPHVEGRTLYYVMARFMMPDGLSRLKGSRTRRVSYKKFVRGLLKSAERRGGDLPLKVAVDQRFLSRKLWEMGEWRKADKLGKDVDEDLLGRLDIPDRKPPHPIYDCELEQSQHLSIEELSQHEQALRPFFHSSAYAVLKRQLLQSGPDALIRSGVDDESQGLLDKEVLRWAEQWGHDNIAETLFDAAYYNYLAGDLDAAATLRSAVDEANPIRRDRSLVEFLTEYMRWVLSGDEDFKAAP